MTAAPRRPAPSFHRVSVAEATELTPHLRRITLTGDNLAGYPNDGPATHCKLVLPAPGESEPPLPDVGPDGVRWPNGGRPTMRTYTPRLVDTAARQLAIDFVTHDTGGPASTWAAAAKPGDTVVVTGGRGAYRIDPESDWTLLVAEESGLPAVATILEDAPAGARVLLVAEIDEEADRLPFSTAADLTITWRERAGTGAAAGDLAVDTVRGMDLPAGKGACWIALEAAPMRTLRRHLISDRGTDRAALYSRAYWKRGVSNHPDHDTGEEDDPRVARTGA